MIKVDTLVEMRVMLGNRKRGQGSLSGLPRCIHALATGDQVSEFASFSLNALCSGLLFPVKSPVWNKFLLLYCSLGTLLLVWLFKIIQVTPCFPYLVMSPIHKSFFLHFPSTPLSPALLYPVQSYQFK